MLKAGTAKTVSALKLKNLKDLRAAVILVGLAAVVVVAALVGNPANPDTCGAYRDDKLITIGDHKIFAELATTPAAQAQGLGGRSCIPADAGMLFSFSQPGRYGFWMKDMKFPIDMVWISAGHQAVAVKQNVQPSTYPDSFANPVNRPAQYVLELQANASSRLKISPGTPVNF